MTARHQSMIHDFKSTSNADEDALATSGIELSITSTGFLRTRISQDGTQPRRFLKSLGSPINEIPLPDEIWLLECERWDAEYVVHVSRRASMQVPTKG